PNRKGELKQTLRAVSPINANRWKGNDEHVTHHVQERPAFLGHASRRAITFFAGVREDERRSSAISEETNLWRTNRVVLTKVLTGISSLMNRRI
ncbi:hypothetical protein Bca52824_081418, partial [Brassica carinata]